MTRPLLATGLLFLWFAARGAANPVTPSTLSITPSHFALAARYSRAHGGLILYVQQNGKALFEDDYPGFSSSMPHRIYSGTKSFVAIAALLAEQDGLLTLDEPASQTLTEWRGDRRRSITIDQLLSQTSGLDPDGESIYSSRDQFAAALRIPLIDPPGAHFHYGAAGYQAFGELLKRKLHARGRSVEGYIRDRLIDPLDIDVDEWKHDDAGNPLLHAGMSLTAKEWAKFGEFLCHGGINKKRQLIYPKLFKRLFTGHKENPAYGLGFWLNNPEPYPRPQRMSDLQPALDGDQLYPGGPRDLIACLGSYRQRLYVIPSLDLVVVRFAYESRYSDGDFLSRLLTGSPKPDLHTH
ncbi:MAG TPA: serine hydrolase domain-containing protein [Candidatus Methylacidiphilales bacterium]|nr:serine hydrolase domain-containing protein [Candidatus Methylacidiphilales bacterium]